MIKISKNKKYQRAFTPPTNKQFNLGYKEGYERALENVRDVINHWLKQD